MGRGKRWGDRKEQRKEKRGKTWGERRQRDRDGTERESKSDRERERERESEQTKHLDRGLKGGSGSGMGNKGGKGEFMPLWVNVFKVNGDIKPPRGGSTFIQHLCGSLSGANH